MLKKLLNISKALSDANRIRALGAVRLGDLCACQITEFLGLAPSTVSKHMNILKNAGFVSARKDGKWVYYHLSEDPKNPLLKAAMDGVFTVLENDPVTRADQKKLKRILDATPLELCRKQGCCSKKSTRKDE